MQALKWYEGKVAHYIVHQMTSRLKEKLSSTEGNFEKFGTTVIFSSAMHSRLAYPQLFKFRVVIITDIPSVYTR